MKLKTLLQAACFLAATTTQSTAATMEFSFRFGGVSGIISGIDDTITGFQNASVRVTRTPTLDGLGGYDQDFGRGFRLHGGQLFAEWAGLTDGRLGSMHNLSLGTEGVYFCFNRFFNTCGGGGTSQTSGTVTYSYIPLPAGGFLLPAAIAGLAAIARRRKKLSPSRR